MSNPGDRQRASPFAAFGVRSFRFQWPADLSTSWAFEMETLILGWYVLVATGSVQLLTVFASLQYIGTLVAPVFGLAGDRIGHRNLLCMMRACYATLATTLMLLSLAGLLSPVHVFAIAALMGIVRPSDQVMRYSLIGATMPPDRLMGAVGIARTTSDSARVMGALAGAGIAASLGMGPAYAVIAAFYVLSLALTWRVASTRGAAAPAGTTPAAGPSAWTELKDAARYVRDTPQLAAAMTLAFLINITAFPLVLGLLPYVAREIYNTGQTGLGYLVASFAFGGLIGSLLMTRVGPLLRPGRMMLVFCALWYAMVVMFAHMENQLSGMPLLMLAGIAQSMGMISMSTMILRNTDARLRGRVMGIRMMAIYGLPIGLLIAGPLIARFGYPVVATLYCSLGLACVLTVGLVWRGALWPLAVPANRR